MTAKARVVPVYGAGIRRLVVDFLPAGFICRHGLKSAAFDACAKVAGRMNDGS